MDRMPDALTVVADYSRADKSGRSQHIAALKNTLVDGQPQPEQLLYWMQMHSHAPAHSLLRGLAADKIEAVLANALKQDAAPDVKPYHFLHTVLNDQDALTERGITSRTVSATALRSIEAIRKNADHAAKHTTVFTDLTDGVVDTFIAHSGKRSNGAQNKNIVKAHIKRYFNAAETVTPLLENIAADDKQKPSSIFTKLLDISKKLRSKKIDVKMTNSFFVTNFARHVLKKRFADTELVSQHIDNALHADKPSSDGKSRAHTAHYLRMFNDAMQDAAYSEQPKLASFVHAHEIYGPLRAAYYASRNDDAKASYAQAVIEAIQPSEKQKRDKPSILASKAELLGQTFALTQNSLQNVAHDPLLTHKTIAMIRTVNQFATTSQAMVASHPSLANSNRPAGRTLSVLNDAVHTTIGDLHQTLRPFYSAETATEIFQQAALQTTQAFPKIKQPPAPQPQSQDKPLVDTLKNMVIGWSRKIAMW